MKFTYNPVSLSSIDVFFSLFLDRWARKEDAPLIKARIETPLMVIILQLPPIFSHNLTIYISDIIGGQQFAYLPYCHGLLLSVIAPLPHMACGRLHMFWTLQNILG